MIKDKPRVCSDCMVGRFETCDDAENSTMFKIPKSEVFPDEQAQERMEVSDKEASESDVSEPERKNF